MYVNFKTNKDSLHLKHDHSNEKKTHIYIYVIYFPFVIQSL